MDSAVLYQIAKSFEGIKEHPGAKHNPQIIEMFAQSGHGWVEDDETPWCAAFVGSVLALAGVAGTSSLAARSYLDWGAPVDPQDAVKGDVVILWRGSKNGWQGHVGFFDRIEGDRIYLLGGNQGDAVNISGYPMDRLLGIRRVIAPRSHPVQSATIQASAAQVGAAATAGVTAVAALDGTAQIVSIVAVGVVILAAIVIFRERLLKWNRGDR